MRIPGNVAQVSAAGHSSSRLVTLWKPASVTVCYKQLRVPGGTVVTRFIQRTEPAGSRPCCLPPFLQPCQPLPNAVPRSAVTAGLLRKRLSARPVGTGVRVLTEGASRGRSVWSETPAADGFRHESQGLPPAS